MPEVLAGAVVLDLTSGWAGSASIGKRSHRSPLRWLNKGNAPPDGEAFVPVCEQVALTGIARSIRYLDGLITAESAEQVDDLGHFAEFRAFNML